MAAKRSPVIDAFEKKRREVTDVALTRAFHPEKIVAEEIVGIYEDIIRFDPTAKEWRLWAPGRGQWGGDDMLGVQNIKGLIGEYVKTLALRSKSRKKVAEVKSLLSARYLGSIVKLAADDAKINLPTPHWDASAHLIGTPAGTVDLETGATRAARPEDYILTYTRYPIAPKGARAPRWQRFLDEVAEGKELQRFLQQWAGASLRGDAVDQRFVFIHGGGGNGKGVYLHTLARVAGKYHTLADPDLLLARRLGQTPPHPTGLAKVLPARMVTATEVPRDAYWNVTLLKLLTGGDEIAARLMFKDFFDLQPRCSITISGNNRPAFDGIDEAIQRRFLLILFEFTAKRRNPHLEAELAEEGPAILRWIADGAVDWKRNGLIVPRSIEIASEEYLREEDLIARFVEERFEMRPEAKLRDATDEGDAAWRVTSGELFDEWRGYVRSVNRDPGSHTAFTLRVQRMEGVIYKTIKGIRLFEGLRPRAL